MHYGSYTTDGALLHMESSEPTSVSVDAVGINGKMLYYEGNEYVMQAE